MNQDFLHTCDPTKLSGILDKYGVAVLDGYFNKTYAPDFLKMQNDGLLI